MRSLFILCSASLALTGGAFAASAPAAAPDAYQESGPRDLKHYLDAGEVPNYIRIDVKNYHIRATPDFSATDTSNVVSKSQGGDLFAVESVKPMYYGAAVEIQVDGKSRWVYVPYSRKDFEFCESDACFSAMAQTLDYLLKGTGVSVANAQACGVTAGPEGLVVPTGSAEHFHEPDAVGDAIAITRPARKPSAPASPVDLQYRPGWEKRSASGKRFTSAIESALDKYGQGLMNQNSLGDAYAFCPNYSKIKNNPELKKNFWVQLFSAIALPESGDKMVGRPYDERNHANTSANTEMDSYGFKHYSMGLFALSYNYSRMPAYLPACAGISARADLGKTVTDPSLSIYDLNNQAECAVGIMNHYVTHHGSIGYTGTAERGPAWSTVMSYNPATRVRTIPELKKNFPVCFQGAQ